MKKSWMRLLAVLCAMMMLVCEIPLIAQAGEVPAEEQQQTEGEATAAAEPVQDVPAAPAEEVPAAPAEEVPAAPAEEAPAAPAEEVPAAPAEEVPAAPAEEVPAAPAEEVPAAPAEDVPAAPAAEEPAVPAADVPAAPSADTPAAPAAPAADAPAAPAADTPAAPAADTPVAPAADTPATPAKPAEQVKADRTMKVYDTAVFTLEAGKSYLIRLDEGKKGRFLIDAQAEFELELQVRDETAKQNIEPEPEKTGEDGEPIPFPCTFVAVKGHTYLLTFKAKDETATGSVTVLVTRPAKYYGTEDNTDDDNEKEEEPKTGDVQADEQKDNTGNTDAGSDDETAAADLTRQDADPDAGNGTADAAAQDTPADGGQQEVPQNQQEDLTDAEPSGEQKQEPAGDSDTDPAKQNEQESDGNKEQEPADDAAQNDGAAAAAKTEIQIEDHKIGEKPKEPVEDQTEGQAEKELSGLSGADTKEIQIQIVNKLITESGDVLKPKTSVPMKFNVYQKVPADQDDWDSVVNVGVPGSAKKADYTGYTFKHATRVTVGKTGTVTVKDKDVQAGMVYIELDKGTIASYVFDENNKLWLYNGTVMQSEYAWRPGDKNGAWHTADGLISIPDVLGNYGTYVDDKGITQELFNEYENFEVTNTYKAYQPTITETSPYQGTGILGPVTTNNKIQYKISYKNYINNGALVIITDELDPNVTFDSASNNGIFKDGKVTWTFRAEPLAEGFVTVTVKVNSSAKAVRKVSNSASIQISDHPALKTETITNPVPNPIKTETAPYQGTGVRGAVYVDTEITYTISFFNYKTETSDIVISDTLDENVQFVEANLGGVNENGTVTWNLKNVLPNQGGVVELKVKVLDSALVSNKGPGKVSNGGKTTTVKVGNDPAYITNRVDNPVKVKPEKVEIAPYEGKGRLGAIPIGETITYEIRYTNYKTEPAKVVIIDPLSKYVTYVEDKEDKIAKYDKDSHTVTWEIDNVEPGASGEVILTVKPKEAALKTKNGPGYVDNSGQTQSKPTTVQIGNDNAYTMSTVRNYVWVKPEKKLTIPKPTAGKKSATVKVGQKMTYEITYRNFSSEAATIVITDQIDPNMVFRSKSTTSKPKSKISYDPKTRIVTWVFENVPSGQKVTAVLKTKVLESARGGKVKNRAIVKVGDNIEMETAELSNSVSKTGEAPDTGDHSNSGLWLALLIFSLLGAGWFGFRLIQAKKAE